MHLRLEWKGGGLFYNDAPLNAADELEAARVLLDRNLAVRSDWFTTWRGTMPCLTTSIGWAADRVVSVNEGGTPIFRKRGRVTAPLAEKSAGLDAVLLEDANVVPGVSWTVLPGHAQ